MKLLPAIVTFIIVTAICACQDNHEGYVPSLPEGADVPTMTTLDVNTFISDSGYVRYHIVADVWRLYEDSPDPFWTFPEGLYLEQYDENLNPAASVVCDSAIYYSKRRIWRLDGNVIMVNTERDSFLTMQLFWDQNKQTVYSDSFMHIVRFDRIIEGYGFESNQNMTAYTVKQPTGIIPVNRLEPALAQVDNSRADSLSSDSAVTQPGSSRRRAIPVRASRRDSGDEVASPVNSREGTLPLQPQPSY